MVQPKLRAEIYAEVLSLFARAMSILLVPLIIAGLVQDAAGDGFLMALPSTFGNSLFLALILSVAGGLLAAWRLPLVGGATAAAANILLILLLTQRYPSHGTHWVFIAIFFNAVFFILSQSILPKKAR